MANVLHEELSKAKAEDIRNKNLKPVNPNISNHLGSQKISRDVFGGYKSHKDNIVPYERNYHPEKKTVVENVNPEDINKAIKDEVKRSGVDEALAGYPPEISNDAKTSHAEDLKEELAEEREKKNFSKE